MEACCSLLLLCKILSKLVHNAPQCSAQPCVCQRAGLLLTDVYKALYVMRGFGGVLLARQLLCDALQALSSGSAGPSLMLLLVHFFGGARHCLCWERPCTYVSTATRF